MEIVNQILHSQVKMMSRRGEALAKHDRRICDLCRIITPLDYKVGGIFLFSLILVGIQSNLIFSISN